MKFKHPLLIFAMLLGALALSACTGGAFAATGWPGVTAEDETAYVAFNTAVYAISLSNGTLQWRFPAEPDNNTTFYSEPALTSDGQLLVGGYNKLLYSLNPDTGSQNWVFEGAGDRYIGGPLVTEDMIFAPNADGSLYALNLSGQLQWTFEAQEALWGRPVSDGERIYQGSMDHNLYALDPISGSVIWTQALGGASVGSPALSPDGQLYLGTFANEMFALDSGSGRILWRAPSQGWIWSGPALHDDLLYFGDLDGMLYALDRASGQEIWRVRQDGPITGTPLVTEDAIYFTIETSTPETPSLVAASHEGVTQWGRTVEGKLYTRPVLAGELILVAALEADELLVAFDQNGTKRWPFKLPE